LLAATQEETPPVQAVWKTWQALAVAGVHETLAMHLLAPPSGNPPEVPPQAARIETRTEMDRIQAIADMDDFTAGRGRRWC
jgi:hypothetical protein